MKVWCLLKVYSMMIIPLTCMTLNPLTNPDWWRKLQRRRSRWLRLSLSLDPTTSSWYRCCLHNVMELQAVLLHSLQMISFVSDFVRKADRVYFGVYLYLVFDARPSIIHRSNALSIILSFSSPSTTGEPKVLNLAEKVGRWLNWRLIDSCR